MGRAINVHKLYRRLHIYLKPKTLKAYTFLVLGFVILYSNHAQEWSKHKLLETTE